MKHHHLSLLLLYTGCLAATALGMEYVPTYFRSSGLEDDCSRIPEEAMNEGDFNEVICKEATAGEVKCVCLSSIVEHNPPQIGYSNVCGHCHDPCQLHFYSSPIPALKRERNSENPTPEI